MRYVVLALIGALAAVLANKGIAVFNDGFRPIVPQFYDGQISRKELAAMSFAISFGLVIGFAIPTSIAASIILIHCILLTTDIIGVFCPDSFVGTIVAGVVGAAYGVAILLGLEFVVKFFAALPFNFLGSLGSVSSFVTAAFAIFPAVAVGHQHGFQKGAASALVTLLVYIFTVKFGQFTLGSAKVVLNGFGMAMLAGMICLIVFAAGVKGEGDANASLVSVFEDKVKRIRSNWWLLAIMGGLVALATSMGVVAGDPISLGLVAETSWAEAGMVALARAIGFIPLVFTTAIVTGVYGPVGSTFVFVVGLFMHGNPILAAVLGAVVMVIELALIHVFAKGMDKFPGMKDMGGHIRTSMNKVLEVALTVGGVVAAEAMAASFSGIAGSGALFVVACLLLNRISKKPIVELAIGPVACIFYGIILNLLLVLNLIALAPVA
ncbi:YhfT family protein [Peptoniphilaceae bacterium SGI.137]|nr:YhfT family protein [Peptoniphilaceae bacterium]MDY4196046.1 YhfT family protein [Peptoniphilaceae bacterium]MDY5841428.1 YhfT family protein [Peptoniphilaceae bacterium]